MSSYLYAVFYITLALLTLNSVITVQPQSCPNILKVPTDGALYRCLSDIDEPPQIKAKKVKK